MNYRSITDLDIIIRKKLSDIPRDVDIIIGIPRSGLLPASIIALLLNKPLISINDLTNDQIDTFSTRSINYSFQYKKAFIIDDSCHSGASMERARKFIKEHLNSEIETVFAAVYVTREAASLVDFYFEICEQPRFFEWNIMNHVAAMSSCFDMDGVLNLDPTDEENDDGPLYENFIRNAVPLFIPKYEIGAIVTSRLEKYRKLTEEWLSKHGVKYKNLIMLDVPDKDTRMRLGLHAPFKALVYDQIGAALFVESDDGQARYINEATNKPVYCTGSNRFYDRNDSFDKYRRIKAECRKAEEDAYNALSIMYDFHDKADQILTYTGIDKAVDTFSEYLTMLNTVFNRVCALTFDSSSLETWINTYINDLTAALNNREPEDIRIFFDSRNPAEVELLIDTSLYEVVHAAGQSVTESAWIEEFHIVEKELNKALIDEDPMLPDFAEEVAFLKNHKGLFMYPYDFVFKYDQKNIKIYADTDRNLKYVDHNGKRLYFPRKSDNDIASEYNQLIMEQDPESPHTYFSKDCCFNDGDIFVDVGAAEGIISLDVVEKAKEIYLIECSDDWIEALEATFEKYKDKIHIIPKFAGRSDYGNTITLDTLLKDYNDENIFIKIDAEGMELDILKSAVNVIICNNCKLACCTYHAAEQEEELTVFFENLGYTCTPSDGYMLFRFGRMVLLNGKYERIERPYFRRALVRAHR